MHLGDQLVQDGVLSQQQLDTALKAQLQFGGRLGTNLIELGFVDPDTLARALSRKLSVPPALQKHFGHVEPQVIGLFSPKFAERYKAIPLGLTVNVPHRLVVAFMDPAPGHLEEVAFAVSRRVEPGVAPELVILHCLEKFYGVKRENRYIRVDLNREHAPAPVTHPPAQGPAARRAGPGELKGPYVPHSPAALQAAASVTSGAKVPMSAEDELLPPQWLSAPAASPPPEAPAAPPPPQPEALNLIEQLPEPEAELDAIPVLEPIPDDDPIPVLEPIPDDDPIPVLEPIPDDDPIPVLEPIPDDEPVAAAPLVPTAIHEIGVAVSDDELLGIAVADRAPPRAAAPMRIPSNDEIERAAAPPEFSIELQITPEEARNGAYRPDGYARMPMESLVDDEAPAPAAATPEEYGEYDPNIPVLEPYESIAPPPKVETRTAMTSAEAIAAIAKAETKDAIADAICDFMRSAFGCGLVLILKDEMALGWKGFATDVDAEVVEAIALPMAGPSMMKLAVDGRAAFKGPPPAEGATLQTRFWKLLRCTPPKEVVVAPIILGKRVVNLVYAHRFDGGVVPAEDMAALASVCESGAAAYLRIIRTGR